MCKDLRRTGRNFHTNNSRRGGLELCSNMRPHPNLCMLQLKKGSLNHKYKGLMSRKKKDNNFLKHTKAEICQIKAEKEFYSNSVIR